MNQSVNHPSRPEVAFRPAIVVIPCKAGYAAVGPFTDLTACWVWIDWFALDLPKGTMAIETLHPNEAMARLTEEGMI
jgi:hypothetical protein